MHSVIAYIDILGYKDLIKKASDSDISQDTLICHRIALNETYDILKQYPGLKNQYEVRWFADNIVLGFPIDNNRYRAETVLENVFQLLAHVQLRMAFNDYFLRGAIAIDELHLDDAFSFGKGLLEAHEAEKNNACNPRIILTAAAKEEIDESSGQYHSRYLLRDTDNQVFLNYLEDIMEAVPEGEPSCHDLSRHKDAVVRNLNKYSNHPKILNKYLWVAHYHNYHCEKYQRYFTDYKIDLSDFRISSIG